MTNSEREAAIKADATAQYTNSTALAAALVSLGFQFKPHRALIRTYTKNKPPGTLGIFHFRLEPASSEWICDAETVRKNWVSREAEHELDKLKKEISEIASAGVIKAAADPATAKATLETIQQKFVRLLEILPSAIVCYQSRMEENHIAIKNEMKRVCSSDLDKPYRRYDHPGKQSFTLVPADMPEDEVAALMAKAI